MLYFGVKFVNDFTDTFGVDNGIKFKTRFMNHTGINGALKLG